MYRGRANAGHEIGCTKHRRRPTDGAHLHPAERRGGCNLPMDDVRIGIEENFGARRTLHPDRGLVRHGPAWEEQCAFLPQPFGHHRLKATRGGIAVEHIVANLCGGHGTTHGRGGPRDGVTPQIEERERHHGRRGIRDDYCSHGRLGLEGGREVLGADGVTERRDFPDPFSAASSRWRRSKACATSPPMRNSMAP